ncbi:MAG: MBL fold metallo-hydrolase [Syntrophomonadaceae bacterium]|jgi:glyoxylase-like metal-dependent hydrolase (beta-lactamase superfamily II)
MMEQISSNFFRMEIPLPKSPLKTLNSYVIKGDDRNLIIDTGLNREQCWEAFQQGIKELDINLDETDFFLTHMHADHCGLISKLATSSSNVYCSMKDAEGLMAGWDWPRILSFAHQQGFPEYDDIMMNHPNVNFKPDPDFATKLRIVEEGDIISIGPYSFECLATPGHTRGHMCLYEKNSKYLIAGDHLLHEITPNITLWTEGINPLKEYLESLDKVYDMEISCVLPGHRTLFCDHRKRIDELRKHHHERCLEILTILKKGRQSAYDIASQMQWDIDCSNWEDFPVPQKWFATGETNSHLKYLEENSLINRIYNNNHVEYSLGNGGA